MTQKVRAILPYYAKILHIAILLQKYASIVQKDLRIQSSHFKAFCNLNNPNNLKISTKNQQERAPPRDALSKL